MTAFASDPFDPGGGFGGARLGMSLAQWRALPTPAPGDPHVVRACDPQADGGLTCRYEDLYGRTELPEAITFGKAQRAWRVRYGFESGRLSSIRFRASIDAFNDLTAEIDRGYGKPTHRSIDHVASGSGLGRARLHSTWLRGSNRIDLIDPSPNPARLEVAVTQVTPGVAPPASADQHRGPPTP